MPKKKTRKKELKKAKRVKKETDLESAINDGVEEEYDGDVGDEVDEVGAEPVYSKDDDEF